MDKASLKRLFVSEIYQASLTDYPDFEAFLAQIDDACRMVADEDEAGQNWSAQKGYMGYTSYASIEALHRQVGVFGELKTLIDRHALNCAEVMDLDLCGRKLWMNSFWINILDPLGTHSGHIHPHSVLSGTFYVSTPPKTSTLKFEDPRLPMMMAAPPRKSTAPEDKQSFVYMAPEPGMILMWESYLRHEVMQNFAEEERISISFNYALD